MNEWNFGHDQVPRLTGCPHLRDGFVLYTMNNTKNILKYMAFLISGRVPLSFLLLILSSFILYSFICISKWNDCGWISRKPPCMCTIGSSPFNKCCYNNQCTNGCEYSRYGKNPSLLSKLRIFKRPIWIFTIVLTSTENKGVPLRINTRHSFSETTVHGLLYWEIIQTI